MPHSNSKSIEQLVYTGWVENYTLEQMKTVLQRAGYTANPYAIIKTWTELDETTDLLDHWR